MRYFFTLCIIGTCVLSLSAQQTQKPVLHGRNWMAITGKPLAATAGALIFQQGGNAVDASCAMLAATCTMWDTLSWGGDTQDQNLLQFFLNVAEFGMNVQQAAEAANFNTNQLWLSLGGTKTDDRKPKPGQLLLNDNTDGAVRNELKKMGYTLSFDDRTSGPINAVYFDWKHGSLWGGSSNHGEDYGIAW